ncbi:MAG: tRNA (adenosine(37)-N6)-threonylcarbamoyltransferase complex dimerization subunit type 1 TsaB [Clostridia bacterium]
MNILAVDTSAVTASAAVMKDGVIVGEVSFTNGLTHSQTIMPMVDYVLKGAGLSVSDIDLFAAVNGPGSFTGLRIGVGTVKGLAYACGKDCAGISTLEALAHNIAPTDLLIVPIMDARRSQVYTAAYRYDGDTLTEVSPPSAVGIEDLCLSLTENVIFVGDGVAPYMDRISRLMGCRAHFAPPQLRLQSAASVAVAAASKAPVSPEKLEVIYLRKPQAEREREASGIEHSTKSN